MVQAFGVEQESSVQTQGVNNTYSPRTTSLDMMEGLGAITKGIGEITKSPKNEGTLKFQSAADAIEAKLQAKEITPQEASRQKLRIAKTIGSQYPDDITHINNLMKYDETKSEYTSEGIVTRDALGNATVAPFGSSPKEVGLGIQQQKMLHIETYLPTLSNTLSHTVETLASSGHDFNTTDISNVTHSLSDSVGMMHQSLDKYHSAIGAGVTNIKDAETDLHNNISGAMASGFQAFYNPSILNAIRSGKLTPEAAATNVDAYATDVIESVRGESNPDVAKTVSSYSSEARKVLYEVYKDIADEKNSSIKRTDDYLKAQVEIGTNSSLIDFRQRNPEAARQLDVLSKYRPAIQNAQDMREMRSQIEDFKKDGVELPSYLAYIDELQITSTPTGNMITDYQNYMKHSVAPALNSLALPPTDFESVGDWVKNVQAATTDSAASFVLPHIWNRDKDTVIKMYQEQEANGTIPVGSTERFVSDMEAAMRAVDSSVKEHGYKTWEEALHDAATKYDPVITPPTHSKGIFQKFLNMLESSPTTEGDSVPSMENRNQGAPSKLNALPDKQSSNEEDSQDILEGGAGVDHLIDRMMGSESGGRDNAKNPKSSASGVLQYVDKTWKAIIKKYPELGLTEADKNKRSAQKLATKTLINKEFIPLLKKHKIPVTSGAVYALHHFNPREAVAILKNRSNHSVDASDLVSEKTADANPSVFFKGDYNKSAAEVYTWLQKRVK